MYLWEAVNKINKLLYREFHKKGSLSYLVAQGIDSVHASNLLYKISCSSCPDGPHPPPSMDGTIREINIFFLHKYRGVGCI